MADIVTFGSLSLGDYFSFDPRYLFPLYVKMGAMSYEDMDTGEHRICRDSMMPVALVPSQLAKETRT